MGRFDRVLRRAERRLEAPEPRRSRILMEMASDLEDLYRTYLERGLGEDDARRKAEAWLAPSSSALEELGSIHLPIFDRLLGRLGGTTRGRVELGLVTLVSLLAVGGGVLAVLRSGALTASSPGLWCVAALGVVGLSVGLKEGYALFVRGDRLRAGWRPRSSRVLAAAAGTALVGLLAAGVRLTVTVVPLEAGSALPAVWSQIATASGVAALGLSASLLLALLWLLLRARAEVVDRARTELREALGEPVAEETGDRRTARFDETMDFRQEAVR